MHGRRLDSKTTIQQPPFDSADAKSPYSRIREKDSCANLRSWTELFHCAKCGPGFSQRKIFWIVAAIFLGIVFLSLFVWFCLLFLRLSLSPCSNSFISSNSSPAWFPMITKMPQTKSVSLSSQSKPGAMRDNIASAESLTISASWWMSERKSIFAYIQLEIQDRSERRWTVSEKHSSLPVWRFWR